MRLLLLSSYTRTESVLPQRGRKGPIYLSPLEPTSSETYDVSSLARGRYRTTREKFCTDKVAALAGLSSSSYLAYPFCLRWPQSYISYSWLEGCKVDKNCLPPPCVVSPLLPAHTHTGSRTTTHMPTTTPVAAATLLAPASPSSSSSSFSSSTHPAVRERG